MNDENTGIPAITGDAQLPVGQGLAHDERIRLDDLKERFRTTSYLRMLGLGWEASPPEVERRARILKDWLTEVSGRPGLNADDRSSITFCEAQLKQAQWVLKHPMLGPAYLKAARARAEIQESAPGSKE